MPSRYSSVKSREDASQLAENLGIRFLTVPIDETFQAYLEMLAEPFAGLDQDVIEENIQARIRGNILMALSNKFGWLVLTTGNKSEVGVGYATLYGDMAGGFAVIKVVVRIRAHDRGVVRLAAGQCDQQLFGVLDDMVVCDDMALGVVYKAGAGALFGYGAQEAVVDVDTAGDVHDGKARRSRGRPCAPPEARSEAGFFAPWRLVAGNICRVMATIHCQCSAMWTPTPMIAARLLQVCTVLQVW
jgi:hypothetical protein